MKSVQELYNSVIIVAAGNGSRLGDAVKKQFMPIGRLPMIVRSIRAFEECDFIDEIIVVVAEEDVYYCVGDIVANYELVKVKSIVSGGDFRQDSVWRGLQEVSADADVVLIHDCARPFVTKDIIEKCIEAAWEFGAAVPAVSVKNTVKKVSDDGFIEETVDRNFLWEVQTPQTFTRSIIIEAHQSYNNGKAAGDIEEASDDAYLVEKLGGKVKIVESSYDNFKITTPNDVLYADFLINDSEDK